MSYELKALLVNAPFRQNQTLLSCVRVPLCSVDRLHIAKAGPKVKDKRVIVVKNWNGFSTNQFVDAEDRWVKLCNDIVGAKGGGKVAVIGSWVRGEKDFVDHDADLGW